MVSRFPIGATVVVRDRQLAEQLGRRDECGVVLQRRRGDARVLFAGDRRAHWIADARLWAIDSPPERLRQLAVALRILAPEEAQLERADALGMELHVLCAQVDQSTLRKLEDELGDSLLRWSIAPQGMALLAVIVEFRA